MTEDMVYTTDPFGRMVYFTKELCKLKKEELDSEDLHDDLFSVIKKPAIIIETSDSPKEFLYFRSIGWQLSVLLHVKFKNKFWEAYKCIINPSDSDIVELLKKGKQIL